MFLFIPCGEAQAHIVANGSYDTPIKASCVTANANYMNEYLSENRYQCTNGTL